MEVVAQGTEAFLRWFEEAALKAKTVKVTLLGNTGAGKSNLVNCLNLMDKTDAEINKTLQNFSASNHSTDVIRIVTKDYEDGVKVYFYDFGGQEHFHGTYNLFLGGGSKGGLVILLVTKKSDRLPFSGKNEDPTDIVFQKPDGTTETRKQSLIRFPPDYWLELIRKKFGYTEISFLEEEVDSNLIIIQNQAKVKGNIGDLTSIKHKYRYKMDLQDPQDFLDDWKKFRLRLQEIIKKDIQEKKVTPTYQVLLELIDEMDPPTPPQPQPSSDPQPESVKPKITRISLIELYNKLQAKLENTEYKEETNRDEKSKQLSFMDALFLLAIGGRIIFLEWEEIVTDEGKLEYINHRKSTPVFFSPELVTQKIAEILDWHKLVEERRDNHLFTEIGNFKKEEVENIEEIDTYLELLTKQKIIFSYRNKDEETVYVAPQYLPCWKELQVGSKETIEAYKNNVGEENITTLYSNLIEPSFFVKLMSDILQNKSFSPVYRDGFCFTTEGFDITIIKKGQKKKEKPAKLLIYFKKEMGSCPKKEFEKCEIKILEKIKKISRKTNTYFFLEEEGRKKELSDYIEYKEGKIALTELNKRIEKLEEMIKEKGLTVLGDYVEGAKNEFKKDSNPRGVFGDSGEYQENPTKEI